MELQKWLYPQCGNCRWWVDNYCTNQDCKHRRKPKLELETCGKWEIPPIKPCPFCGGEANLCRITQKINKVRVIKPVVFCTVCGTKHHWKDVDLGETYNENIRIAIDAWNRRAE